MPTYRFDCIPAELRELKQWVLWKYEDKGSGKPTKVPYSSNGNLASVTNPSSWCDFNTAINIYNLGGYDGIGFVFTENDPYAFIDLDHTNDQADYERQLKANREFDSYSEVSPSGQGLHIIVKGSIPQGRKRSSIEIYSSGRYATMTGIVYDNKPIVDRHEMLNSLFQQMGGPPQTYSIIDEPQSEDDNKIIEMASQAINGVKFTDLFCGNWSNYYPTQSEADFALIDIIAFYTQNRNQIDRIFKKSSLGKRDKANRKDYIGYMINKSFDRQLPKLDMDGWKIQLEDALHYQQEQLNLPLGVSVNGKPSPFDGATTGSNPVTPANNNSANNSPVAQSVELSAHNTSVASSNLAGTTNNYSTNTIDPPPGLVGEIAQFIYQSAPRPVPEIAIAGAMGLMAGICGRAYNVSGTGLNQYILLLAKTGSGKEAMAYGIDKLINAVQLSVPVASEFVGPSEIQSGQALIKNLSENSSYVSLLGEFGLRLRAMSSDKANGAEIALRRMLLDLYNKSGYGQMIRPTIYSDKAKNIAAISSPAFSILGESTPERFYEILTEEMISEGLLPRFTIIEYNGMRPPLNENAINTQPPLPLVEKIASLMANAKTVLANRKVINIECTPEADEVLKNFDKLADARINNTNREVILQLWNRAHIKALKIAGLIACGQNIFNPVIQLSDVKWAIYLIEHDIKALSEKFDKGVIGKSSNENKQVDEMIRVFKEYVTLHWEKVKKYSDNQALYSSRIVTNSFIMRRCACLAAFKNDRIGSTASIKRTLQVLLDSDFIREVGRKELVDKYRTTQKSYMITNMNLIGEIN